MNIGQLDEQVQQQQYRMNTKIDDFERREMTKCCNRRHLRGCEVEEAGAGGNEQCIEGPGVFSAGTNNTSRH